MKNPLFIFAIIVNFLCFHSPMEAKRHSVQIEYEYELAMCAIFQNESSYIREWIEFHKLVGVEHFFLYNHLSTDDYLSVLAPYIQSGEVELIEWDYQTYNRLEEWNKIQLMAYDDAIQKAKNKVKWLAVLDTDEFIFPVKRMNLARFLRQYDDCAAVCVNWQMYGTSDVEEILPGHLLIEDLIYKAASDYGENRHIKSIVRPELVVNCQNPHFFNFLPGFFQVDANKKPFTGPFRTPIQIDKVRINHYWTRDRTYFYQQKIARRETWGDTEIVQRANNYKQEVDQSILKYAPKLRKALGLQMIKAKMSG